MESKYTRTAGTDSEEDLLESTPTPSLYRRLSLGKRRRSNGSSKLTSLPPYMKILKDLFLYSLALWGAYNVLRRMAVSRSLHTHEITTQTDPLQGCDCGDSVAEAISRDCKFDALSMAWLPEHCRDDELTAEFDTIGNGPNGTWVYYADTEHTIEVDVAIVAAMGDDPSARVHMGKTWHTIHCIFYWRKQFRTRLNGKIVEPRSDSEDHIKHCGMVFQEPGYGISLASH